MQYDLHCWNVYLTALNLHAEQLAQTLLLKAPPVVEGEAPLLGEVKPPQVLMIEAPPGVNLREQF